MDCSPPRSSIHGIFQARILQWVAKSFSKDSLPSAYFYIGGNFSSESCRYYSWLCLSLLRNSAFGFVILFSLFSSFSLCPLCPETSPASWGKTYQPRAHLCKYLLSDAWMEEWMDRWTDGWMDGQTDGWMDGQMDGWMDRWMDAQVTTGSRLHDEWLLWPISSLAAAKRRKELQSPAPGSKAGLHFFWLLTH